MIQKDRVQFVKDITLPDSLQHCMREYFDEMMCIFDIIQYISIYDVKMDYTDDNKLIFLLVFDNSNDVLLIRNRLEMFPNISMYGKIFKTSSSIIDSNTIQITLSL